MKKAILLMTLLSVLSAMAATTVPPPDDCGDVPLPGYRQTITLTFATPEEAQKAELLPCPLPGEYKMALSARWDDSNSGHLNTLQRMQKHGIKGTFFFVTINPAMEKLSKAIFAAGSGVGLHTHTHPLLPMFNANAQFQEYMVNKIEIETILGYPATTQVLPYRQCRGQTPVTAMGIGRVLRSAGVIATPEGYAPHFAPLIGYKTGALAELTVIAPGDRKIDRPKFDQNFAKALAAPARKQHPALSFGVHSWHPAEELPKLEKVFADWSGKPDFWYCNANEYGAYRYEYHHTEVKKTVNGNQAKFELLRFRPEELGARLPLWFQVKNAVPAAASYGVKIAGKKIAVEHAPNLMPTGKFLRSVTDFPGLKFSLSANGKLCWKVQLANGGKLPLADCTVLLHYPPKYRALREFRELGEIAPGSGKELLFVQKTPQETPEYQVGTAKIYAALNFTCDGKRYRVYTEYTEPEVPVPAGSFAAESLMLYPVNQAWDLAALSRTGVKLPQPPLAWPEKNNAAMDTAICRNYQNRKMKAPVVTLAELECATAGTYPFVIGNVEKIFCNGTEFKPSSRYLVNVRLKNGRNRLVLWSKSASPRYVKLGLPKKPGLRFVPVAAQK